MKITKLENGANPNKISFNRFQPNMDDKEYIKLFDEADILLLPYRLRSYQNRGSGVVADGVLADKIFVYTGGIGMEKFLKYGNGLPSNSSTNFAENIMKILLNFESFNTQTHMARNEYLKRLNETKLYLKKLL